MGCCGGIAKILLFVVNICVWLVGIVLIGIGAWVLTNSEEYSYLFGEEDTLIVVSGFIIGIGCFIFIVGFCACCGAIKEITFLLKVYFGLMLIIVILEVVAAILAFVFQDEIKKALTESIGTAVQEYDEDSDEIATKSLDAMQKDFDCCGGASILDWAGTPWGTKIGNLNKAGPESCCKKGNRGDGCNANTGAPGIPTTADMNIVGCVDGFADWLQTNYVIVGGVCLGLLVFEIMAMIFACCLISSINDDK